MLAVQLLSIVFHRVDSVSEPLVATRQRRTDRPQITHREGRTALILMCREFLEDFLTVFRSALGRELESDIGGLLIEFVGQFRLQTDFFELDLS